MTIRIAVVNQKGGVGKTTATINIGACLARQDRVLIIDLDPQGNSTMGLGIGGDLNLTVADLLADKSVSVNDVVLETEIKGLALIPADIGLAGLEFELVRKVVPQTILQRKLKGWLNYDWIIFDCPPSLGLFTLNALVASDWFLVPVRPAAFSLKGLHQLMEVVEEVKDAANSHLQMLGILIAEFDTPTKLAHEVLQHLQKTMDVKDARVLKTFINRNVSIEEAQGYGQPIFEYAPTSKGARDYAKLAEEVRRIVKNT